MNENNHMNENNIESTPAKKGRFSNLQGIHKAVPIILAALAAFVAVCLFTVNSGVIGPAIGGLLRGLFSIGAYAIPIVLLLHAYCYPDDLEQKRILKRAIFSIVLVITISCIDYAIYSFDGALFSPAQNYAQMIGGGFVGGVIGFAFTKLLGSIGAIPVAFTVWGIGLALGGPTGYSINPARDLAPRVMHTLLPMGKKESSRWDYAWVPVIAPLCGASAAALLYTIL